MVDLKKLLIFILFPIFLVAAGCKHGDLPDDKTVPGGSNVEQNDVWNGSGDMGSNNAEIGSTGVHGQLPQVPAGQDTSEKILPDNLSDEGLVMKSENHISAGSGQVLVNEMDKEIDTLVESLENLDSISTGDLEVE
ncbi:hypothetical protein [Phosphitispora sp. TUW77]|uniref:hypothetical protein n=1 Tax=Phosphitispora sp. TUW77 TaxID=3152361 RepID=UPI003AB6EE34